MTGMHPPARAALQGRKTHVIGERRTVRVSPAMASNSLPDVTASPWGERQTLDSRRERAALLTMTGDDSLRPATGVTKPHLITRVVG